MHTIHAWSREQSRGDKTAILRQQAGKKELGSTYKTMKRRFENIRRSKQGFTLVELIVVVLILGVLSGMALPSLTGYIDKTQETVCAHNRTIIERVYLTEKLYDSSTTLEAIIAGTHGAQPSISGASCPSGGIYVATADGHVACSVHGVRNNGSHTDGTGGTGGTGGSDMGDGTGGTGGDTGGDTSGDTDEEPKTIEEIVEEILYELSTDWEDFKEQASQSPSGLEFEQGTLISDETGFYFVARNDNYISNSQTGGIGDMDPSGNIFARIDTSTVLTSADYDAIGKWSTPPQIGSLYEYNGSLYVCVYGDGPWADTNPTKSKNWALIA